MLRRVLLPFNVHPLLFFTISLMAGIWWHTWSILLAALLVGIHSGIVFAILFVKLPTTYLKYALAHSLFFISGIFLYNHKIQSYDQFYALTNQKPCSFIGIIDNKTVLTHSKFKYCITTTVSTIIPQNAASPLNASGTYSVMIYTRKPVDFEIGDCVLFDAIIFKKPTHDSFALYALKEGIVAYIFADKLDAQVITKKAPSFWHRITTQRQLIFTNLKHKMSRKTFTFFSPLFLGNKHVDVQEMHRIKHNFQLWGLSHYLARSGLHMVIFVLLWEFILKFVPVSLISKNVFLLTLSSIYFLLSWSSISFIRAFLTFMVYKLLCMGRRHINTVHALTLVTLTVLITNPLHLFFLDFQLSFGLTFALAWVSHIHTSLASYGHRINS
jgi:ComEC/Rec2-related protein